MWLLFRAERTVDPMEMDGRLGEQRLHLGRINEGVCAATLNGNERIKMKKKAIVMNPDAAAIHLTIRRPLC